MKIKCIATGPIAVNTYIVSDEETKKAAIFDPGARDQKVDDYINEKGLTIECIILTHGHSDHIGGVAYYREKYGAKVYLHEADQQVAEDARLNFSKEVYRQDFVVKADVFVKEGDEIKAGLLTWKVIHTPGHTPGGMCLLAGDALFSGDTLFDRSVGRTDFSYSDTGAIIKAIREKLFTLPDEVTVYPGHMTKTTIGAEKRQNPYAG